MKIIIRDRKTLYSFAPIRSLTWIIAKIKRAKPYSPEEFNIFYSINNFFRKHLGRITVRKPKRSFNIDIGVLMNADMTMALVLANIMCEYKKHAMERIVVFCDEEDVPEEIREKDPTVHGLWMLDEIIWTFKMISTGGPYLLSQTQQQYKQEQQRVDNGLRLFAKYFRSFWI